MTDSARASGAEEEWVQQHTKNARARFNLAMRAMDRGAELEVVVTHLVSSLNQTIIALESAQANPIEEQEEM